ncbi:hypothetical protein, conserved [Plasmodium ovale]|uniref:Uncharacterized protein n=1 Tax=Plasmodium ovale TaxID=36330 RepID=A0A1C3KR08_PLAOA|nr:hypothetical protein, conserved [Plasmodium ovale]
MDINRLITIGEEETKLDDALSHKLENSAVKKDHEELSDQKKKRNEKAKKRVNEKYKEDEEEEEGNNEGDNAGHDKAHAQDYKEHYDGEHTTIHEGHEPATEHEIEM